MKGRINFSETKKIYSHVITSVYKLKNNKLPTAQRKNIFLKPTMILVYNRPSAYDVMTTVNGLQAWFDKSESRSNLGNKEHTWMLFAMIFVIRI